MPVRKRTTSGGQSTEYHYEFMQGGKRYYGVCEGCTTERAALAYEKNIRDTVKAAAEQKSVKALIDNFREVLTGGEALTLAKQNKSRVFAIPYDRQELADYLGVERSAMSAELSKLRREGRIDYHKNQFKIFE